MEAMEYAHVFLFRCPACHGGLTAVCFNFESNLETADGQVLRRTCDCGWTGELVGFMAVRHWVQPWESGVVKDVEGPSKSMQGALGFGIWRNLAVWFQRVKALVISFDVHYPTG